MQREADAQQAQEAVRGRIAASGEPSPALMPAPHLRSPLGSWTSSPRTASCSSSALVSTVCSCTVLICMGLVKQNFIHEARASFNFEEFIFYGSSLF